MKLIVLILYFAILIGIGFYCRKKSTDVNSFVLGGRNVGPWLTAFSYGTSYFSAVIFVGYAGQFGWKFGLSSTWIGIGNAIIGSLLAWIILGKRTRTMSQHLNSSTMPEFFGNRFNSNALKICASVIIFVFMIPYTASLYNGLSRLFGMAFNIDYSVCIILMTVLTAIYVTAGGYMATAINDFIQGIIMLFGIVIIIVAVLKTQGGISQAFEDMKAVQDVSAGVTNGEFASVFGPDVMGLMFVVLLTSLGTWGLPQMVQKFYAITDEKAIFKGTVISTVFALIVAGGCYFLGGFGRLIADNPNIYNAEGKVIYDAIVPEMLSTLSPALIALVVILVLSASMSTLSALVFTSSSTLTIDFLKGNFIKEMSQAKQVRCIRVFIVVFIVISAVIALIQYNSSVTFIAQLMGISWGAMAGAFLAPFMFSLYSKKITSASCWVCFIFSTVLMILNMTARQYFPEILQSPINCGVFAMVSGFIIVPVVSSFTKKQDKNRIEEIFKCYEHSYK
ncbi:MAG: sodium:solute symporter [Paludibacteraceae bacterium]|nr:sodium:solute symporter [Paludibacteraceae bacterium]